MANLIISQPANNVATTPGNPARILSASNIPIAGTNTPATINPSLVIDGIYRVASFVPATPNNVPAPNTDPIGYAYGTSSISSPPSVASSIGLKLNNPTKASSGWIAPPNTGIAPTQTIVNA